MKNVGVFGGGQLAKMIMLEGYKMGFNFNVYDPNENACAKPLANSFFNYDFLDKEKISEFIKINDVFTYEFENVDPSFLEEHTNKIPQGVLALQLLQDRYYEKNFINDLDGIKTVKFTLANEINNISTPFIIKTRRLGYDGKGQYLIKNKNELKEEYLTEDYIIEEFIEGIEEYSVVIGRNKNGAFYEYKPIKNVHKKGILYESTFDSDLEENLQKEMINKSRKIIEKLNYYGVLCVEFFVKDGLAYVNEIAPRVHNSGHLTLEASNVSQFKLHLLCILGLEVPKIQCYDNYYMVNVLGHDLKNVEKMQGTKEFKEINYHIYGKNSYVKNRKVGHLTFKDEDGLLEKVKKNIIGGTN